MPFHIIVFGQKTKNIKIRTKIVIFAISPSVADKYSRLIGWICLITAGKYVWRKLYHCLIIYIAHAEWPRTGNKYSKLLLKIHFSQLFLPGAPFSPSTLYLQLPLSKDILFWCTKVLISVEEVANYTKIQKIKWILMLQHSLILGKQFHSAVLLHICKGLLH